MCEISPHKHDDRCVEREPLRRAADPRADAQNLIAYYYVEKIRKGIAENDSPVVVSDFRAWARSSEGRKSCASTAVPRRSLGMQKTQSLGRDRVRGVRVSIQAKEPPGIIT